MDYPIRLKKAYWEEEEISRLAEFMSSLIPKGRVGSYSEEVDDWILHNNYPTDCYYILQFHRKGVVEDEISFLKTDVSHDPRDRMREMQQDPDWAVRYNKNNTNLWLQDIQDRSDSERWVFYIKGPHRLFMSAAIHLTVEEG